jgi:uncharacterized protein YjbI with pentapeptide repeats
MAHPDHLGRLKKSVPAWNDWRIENSFVPDLNDADLRSTNLSGADLTHAHLKNADLRLADLTGTNLREANLDNAELSDAYLSRANLTGATLFGANLTDARITNARLSYATLDRATLTRADLEQAALDRATLEDTNLTSANLRNADLTSALLQGANLTATNLTNANLFGADLSLATIVTTVLRRTNLSHSTFQWTIVGRVDMSLANGLSEIVHLGPSSIGIDTIYRSKGALPEQFLRGAGVPDIFIQFAKSLVTNPIEFYSCFISYSTKDQDFADRLFADLQAKGVRCWFAPRDAQRGRKLHEQIDEAIRVHEKLLLILSPDSMNSSWVKTEIANTRAREKREGVQMLFPVRIVPFDAIRDWKCFDADTSIDSAREIREYLVADFSNWKDHDSYQKEFDKLIRDLQSKRRNAPA